MPFRKDDENINRRGRPPGVLNKVTGDMKSRLSEFLESRFGDVEEAFDNLRPRDKIKMFAELLPYILPRLRSVETLHPVDRLTDDEVEKMFDGMMAYVEGELSEAPSASNKPISDT